MPLQLDKMLYHTMGIYLSTNLFMWFLPTGLGQKLALKNKTDLKQKTKKATGFKSLWEKRLGK